MSKLHSIFVTAVCLGLAPSIAVAQEAKPPQGLSMEQARAMDADRNGRITEDEFLGESSDHALFVQLDANLDGVLDSEEQRLGIRIPVRTLR